MKKVLVTVSMMVAFVFQLAAQVDHDFNPNDRVPVVNAKITKDQVPAQVLQAFNTQFDKNNPATWSKFPYALKEYGWVYDVGASDLPLNRFEVTMKTSSGSELWALYSAEGDLIETREVLKDSPIPASVKESLAKSQYKDWAVVGNREVIRYFHDHNSKNVEQHYRVTVEKDGVKKAISFNYQGNIK